MKGNFQVYMSVPLKHIKTSLLIKRVIKRDITTTARTYIHATTIFTGKPIFTQCPVSLNMTLRKRLFDALSCLFSFFSDFDVCCSLKHLHADRKYLFHCYFGKCHV